MSDLEDLGLRLQLHRQSTVEQARRAAIVAAAVSMRQAEPGSGVVLPVRFPGNDDVLTLRIESFGLAGAFMIGLIHPVTQRGQFEVYAFSDDTSRTLALFPNSPGGRALADACGRGALDALRLALDQPPAGGPKPAA